MKIPESVLDAAKQFNLERTFNPSESVYQSDMYAAQVMARFIRSCPTADKLAEKGRRERIATAAMAGLLADSESDSGPLKTFAARAVVAADSLIAELDREASP